MMRLIQTYKIKVSEDNLIMAVKGTLQARKNLYRLML